MPTFDIVSCEHSLISKFLIVVEKILTVNGSLAITENKNNSSKICFIEFKNPPNIR